MRGLPGFRLGSPAQPRLERGGSTSRCRLQEERCDSRKQAGEAALRPHRITYRKLTR